MSASRLRVPVHIVEVLGESLPEGLASLAYLLLATSWNITADGIADIFAIAVQLRIQVYLVGGGSCMKGLSRLNKRAG